MTPSLLTIPASCLLFSRWHHLPFLANKIPEACHKMFTYIACVKYPSVMFSCGGCQLFLLLLVVAVVVVVVVVVMVVVMVMVVVAVSGGQPSSRRVVINGLSFP